MSTSYSAGVILGVKLSEIGFNAELVSVPYEIHDKKGKPTGKFENDKLWKIDFQGNDVPYEHGDSLYYDAIEEIIDMKSPLVIFDNRDWNEENSNIDKIVIGIDIVNSDDDDYNFVEEINVGSEFEFIKAELEKQFGVNVNPKLYYYFKIS